MKQIANTTGICEVNSCGVVDTQSGKSLKSLTNLNANKRLMDGMQIYVNYSCHLGSNSSSELECLVNHK